MAAETEGLGSATPLEQLAGLLLADAERIAGRGAARMQELLPSYAKVPREALLPVVLANTRNILEAIRDPATDPARAEADHRASGEARAKQGITSDEMLHAWRIGLDVVREEAHAIADELAIGKDVLLEFVEATLRWGDIGMRASASAHREAELEIARHEQHHRTNLVRGILFGTLSPGAIRVQAGGYGLDLAARYHAVRARPSAALTMRALERQLGVADGAGPRHPAELDHESRHGRPREALAQKAPPDGERERGQRRRLVSPERAVERVVAQESPAERVLEVTGDEREIRRDRDERRDSDGRGGAGRTSEPPE
jgi:hypothetical protein